MFSTILTNVPSRGSTTPVFCDLIGLLVFKGSPGLILNISPWISRCLVIRVVRPLSPISSSSSVRHLVAEKDNASARPSQFLPVRRIQHNRGNYASYRRALVNKL